jgi:hypothetical protein
VNEGDDTYEAEIWQDERILEVSERVRREDRRAVAIMTESAPMIARIRRAFPKPTQSLFSVTATSHPGPLTKSAISLSWCTSAAYVARAEVDREALDASVDDAFYEGQCVLLCWEEADLRGD